MTQSEYRTYVQMWTKDRNAFDRWMKASAVAGSLFAAVVLVMAIGSSKVSGPQQVAARATAATEISAAARHGERKDTISPYELTLRFAPDQLPLQEVHYPY
jgi:hypothetical protein